MKQHSVYGLFGLMVLLSGCAEHTLNVAPKVETVSSLLSPLKCALVHESNNKEYLPSMIEDDPASSCLATYRYHVTYNNGGTNWDVLNIWNPLLIVGFPMSQENVIVEAKLLLKDEQNNEKEFLASCVADKTRNLFQNSGSTAPRKACLIAVKNNIDTQLHHFKKEKSNE